MQVLSIPASECLYYDYSQAAAFFKKLGCKNTPQLGLLTYFEDDKTSVPTIGWYSKDPYQIWAVPAFKDFDDNGYEHVFFTPFEEHQIFLVDKKLYMTVPVEGKLGIRRINVLFDESIVGAFNSICGLPETELELCKIYRQNHLLGYYWVGKLDKQTNTKYPTMTISPAFGFDDDIFNMKYISELKIIKVEIGDTIVHNATLWHITYNERYGVTISYFIDFPDNSKTGKYMLN